MSLLAATALVAALLAARTDRRSRLRVPRPSRPAVPPRRRRRLVAVAVPAVVVGAVALAGPRAAAGMALLVGALLVRRRRRPPDPLGAGAVAICLDVLAACIGSGASTAAGLAAAAASAPLPVARTLSTASSALSRGEDPARIWTQVGIDVPELAGAARLCARAAATGAAITDELHRMAASARAAADTSRRQHLQRASVWLVLPLGLCFLPAFVVVGVVPLIAATVPSLAH